MHQKSTTHVAVDYYAKKITKWRWLIYPWAVQEDISSFIKRLSSAPGALEETQQLLAKQFGLRVKRRSLEEVHAFMDR
jgi:hypoxanthine phosphoribosyltransferase